MTLKIGFGYDIHRFKKNRPLILGGVRINYPRGLDGHSDADVLTHAIMDAICGATGLKDIGTLFPNTDKKLKGISSLKLLKIIGDKIHKKGFTISNIDSTIIAEEPRIAPFSSEMANNIAKMLQIKSDSISIKATTNERLGPIGSKKGIAAFAVALINKK